MKTAFSSYKSFTRVACSTVAGTSGTAWWLFISAAIAWINIGCATTKPIPTPIPSPISEATNVYTVEEAQAEWTKYVSAGHATATEELAYGVALTNREKAIDNLKVAFAVWMGRTTTPKPDDTSTTLDVNEALNALDIASGKLLSFVNQTVRNKKQVVDMPPIPRP